MQGGNGGMVIDNDGVVRGMAIYCSPYPAVTSISTIVKCIVMFMQFKVGFFSHPIYDPHIRT